MKAHLQKNKNSGKLIVFEGTDGAGKTTLIELCREWLREHEMKNHMSKTADGFEPKNKTLSKMMYSRSSRYRL
ncbi:MAG: hypothetical protein ACLTTW_06095 [Coprobacter sp.]